jgi:uncharacterized coiled-coil protein SlyX
VKAIENRLINLERRIKSARKTMEDLYFSKGFTDYEVLKAGDKLDRLLNEYDRIKNQRGLIDAI